MVGFEVVDDRPRVVEVYLECGGCFFFVVRL